MWYSTVSLRIDPFPSKVIQIRETITQFTILPFLNITPRAFTKISFPAAWALANMGIQLFGSQWLAVQVLESLQWEGLCALTLSLH